MFHAAKLLYQTAKTCLYIKENYKKMHFILGVEAGDWLAPFFVGILVFWERKKEQAMC